MSLGRQRSHGRRVGGPAGRWLAALAVLGWVGVASSGCTGTGVDRSGAVVVRATLQIRPVAEGDPWTDAIVAVAQGQELLVPDHVSPSLPPEPLPVEVEPGQWMSSWLPPVPVLHVRADDKATLEQAVARVGTPPPGRAAVYERMADRRWSLLVVHTDDGLTLGPGTAAKLADEPSRGIDGVYLLLEPADGKQFETLSGRHVGRRLAILAGDEVLMAPTVEQAIEGPSLLIIPGPGQTSAQLYETLVGEPPPSR